MVGLFQYHMLCMVETLGDNAYPAEITRRVRQKLNRSVDLAQVHVALRRMEERGMIRSTRIKPDRPQRGGRSRRIYTLNDSGRDAMIGMRSALKESLVA